MQEEKRYFIYGAAGAAVVLLIALAVFGVYQKFLERHAVSNAERQLAQGFAAAAVDTLEPYRMKLVKSEKDCEDLIQAYLRAKNLPMLEWASEACLENQVLTAQVYEGYASVAQQQGRIDDAINSMAEATRRFSKDPELFLNLGKLLRERNDYVDSLRAFEMAVQIAQNRYQVLLEAIQYLGLMGNWPEAAKAAYLARNLLGDAPEEHLIVSRALLKSGDQAAGKEQLAKARELLAQRPEWERIRLQKMYADIL